MLYDDIRNPVADEEKTTLGHWLEPVLGVTFSALMLLAMCL